jgi:hypothetical protein
MTLDEQIQFARDTVEILAEDKAQYKASNAARITANFHISVLASLLKLKRLQIREELRELQPKN